MTPRLGPLPLGTTGLTVTPLGLGLAALGRPGYVNLGHGDDLGGDRSVGALCRATHSVLDRAWEHGIRYFDVARSYGRGEEFLGAWLRERAIPGRDESAGGAPSVDAAAPDAGPDRQRIGGGAPSVDAAAPDAGPDRQRTGGAAVGSKWGYTYTAGWRVDADTHEVKDHSLATLRRQLPETRSHLGDHLALYQVHSATLETGVLEDAAVRGALAELADAGVVVGLTLSGPGQAETLGRALEVAADGAPFRCVQATWNLLEPSVGPMLAVAHDAGWGVIVKEAVANGRLTSRAPTPPVLADVARHHDVDVDAVAMAAVLAQPFVDVVLSGAATVAQLDSNVRAVEVALSDHEIGALATLAEAPEDYWSRRRNLAWT